MPAPPQLADLVARFREQLEDYKRGQYNETQLRRDFLDPFFRLLGWDVDNTTGYAESFREVVHEDAVKVGGTTKAPDYSFRIGGRRLFFLEAKKPSVSIKEDIAPAYQLRRYAWSAGLQLSILSDFEEFAVYDGSIKPIPQDKPARARIFYCTFEEYADKWDEIAALFSKDAVLKGGIERFVKKLPGRRGTTTVDAEFLAQIEAWRELLAKNIALRNNGLDVHALNHAVQATIDRIVFLRICEDRGIEDEGRLLALTNGAGIYARLTKLFRDADDRYNSGLFHFKAEKSRAGEPDEFTLGLTIDDKPLKDIIRGLYYPESPYEFSVLPADILGQVYERFLGKVIRLTAGGQAKVEEKPEVKKAGGVYYTPTYIVDYIVRQTVGKLLEGKTPKQAEKLRICDPACGSGSFLIGAYQSLLDWHLKWYAANEPEKHAKGKSPKLRQSHDGWRLTVAERKRILLNNIHGVDIDAQAVEVTKLSLLLKVLEGETGETLGLAQKKLFHERALPDLDANILCGNSLIGTDFFEGRLDLDEDERRRVNAFDWTAGFPEVFKAGGFDAVIGNPPYIRIQTLKEWAPLEVEHYKSAYRAASKGNYDIYAVFVERGLQLLNKQGRLGFIVPNKFFRTDYGEAIRHLLSDRNAVSRIVDFGHSQVFEATTYTCLIFLEGGSVSSFAYAISEASAVALPQAAFSVHTSKLLTANAWTFESAETSSLLAKLSKRTKRLLDLPADMSRGSSTGNDEVFVFENGTLNIEQGILREPVFASDFGRYRFATSGKWKIIFPYVAENGVYRLYTEQELKRNFPRAYTYLYKNQQALKQRKQFKEWFGYSAPRNLALHDRAQISVPLLADKGLFAFIPNQMSGKLCPMASGGFSITLSEQCMLKQEYVLGLLNSKLLFWRLRGISNLFRGGWITCTKQYFGELPIRTIDFSNTTDHARHDRMVKLVESMLKLHEQLAAAKTAHDKTLIQRQIDATDRQIDTLVYELYGLSEDEIRIVEASVA